MQKTLTFALIFFFVSLIILSKQAFAAISASTGKTISIPRQMILPIGVKIWSNESSGSFNGILCWNEGEDFASLGIGHFVWRPKHDNSRILSQDDFPRLLKYMQKRGVIIPNWLQGDNAQYCPWYSREDFYFAKKINSPQFWELRQLLLNTIPIQAEYIAFRLETVLPQLLASVPPSERPYICQKFYALIHTKEGLYAMADYLNFKGSGASKYNHKHQYRCGLLQVLEEMHDAPKNLSNIEAFAFAAKMLLVRHVVLGQTKYNEDIWVNGWLNRVATYLPQGERI